ncbi:YbaB/EbfC family nucleoid-associated protein [Saccharothrix sp. HUAS TT1]|uniref:YbaB/EbfC family nucleoid-associated protein n=1 Tax=unclassified Saccharothrix TaxID=2593673 RepID=UPI00345B56A7
MSDQHTEHLEQLFAQLREQQRLMAETQQRLQEIQATVTAPRRVVSVTVGHGGRVTDVKFPTAAYKKMPPAELAGVLVDTIAEAQRKVGDEAAELLAPQMPAGLDAKAIFSGEFDAKSFVPPESGLPESLRAALRTKS